VTRIQSIVGAAEGELIEHRPFRAPHHSITTAGLIGGAHRGWIGEVVLAHRGVLFLDELSEFARPALDALRQPLEDGKVAIARSSHTAVYPARFMLLAATNPCPCGYAGERERCACKEADHARHRRRLNGPLLDRLDMVTHLQRESSRDPTSRPLLSSKAARERVVAARERQARRFEGESIGLNASMDLASLRRHVRLDHAGEELLASVQRAGSLSARGEQRLLRVARTIADLEGRDHVAASHVAEAIALRAEGAMGMGALAIGRAA
jgi:magnesium chelatase family protein